MQQELVITVGLPGSGKSTYIDDNNLRNKYTIVSADIIKTILPGYNPEDAHKVHEESIRLAEQDVYSNIISGKSVLMDGGAINNKYTLRIIEKCRKINPLLFVRALFFNTPIDVCIERVSKRNRHVPIDDIYRKNSMLTKCLYNLKNVVNDLIEINYFTNKHIFIDLDGTVASYIKAPKDQYQCIDFVSSDMFRYLLPVDSIISHINNLENRQLYVLTACPNSIAWEHKKEWIKKHLSFIDDKNVFFVGNKDYKHVFLRQLMNKNKLNVSDVTMIDDTHDILDKMREIGVNAVHPSNIDIIK